MKEDERKEASHVIGRLKEYYSNPETVIAGSPDYMALYDLFILHGREEEIKTNPTSENLISYTLAQDRIDTRFSAIVGYQERFNYLNSELNTLRNSLTKEKHLGRLSDISLDISIASTLNEVLSHAIRMRQEY